MSSNPGEIVVQEDMINRIRYNQDVEKDEDRITSGFYIMVVIHDFTKSCFGWLEWTGARLQ